MHICELVGTRLKPERPRYSATSSGILYWACRRAIDPCDFANLRVFARNAEFSKITFRANTQRLAETLRGERMEFELNETQRLFQRSARELFVQECPLALVREMIEKSEPYSDPIWNKLVEQGWTGLIFSEDDGGLGLSTVEMAIAFEEMGRALVPGGFLSTVALAGSLIEKACSPEYRSQRLQAICEGKSKATVALLEESASWYPDAVKLSATPVDGGCKLSGAKMFV